MALTSVAMKSFERLVLAYLKDITGPLLDPLQFAYRANRSVDDAVNMGLHYILQHLDRPGTYIFIYSIYFILKVKFSNENSNIIVYKVCIHMLYSYVKGYIFALGNTLV